MQRIFQFTKLIDSRNIRVPKGHRQIYSLAFALCYMHIRFNMCSMCTTIRNLKRKGNIYRNEYTNNENENLWRIYFTLHDVYYESYVNGKRCFWGIQKKKKNRVFTTSCAMITYKNICTYFLCWKKEAEQCVHMASQPVIAIFRHFVCAGLRKRIHLIWR